MGVVLSCTPRRFVGTVGMQTLDEYQRRFFHQDLLVACLIDEIWSIQVLSQHTGILYEVVSCLL